MTTDIRIVQFFKLTDSDGDVHRYQNYFVYSNKTFASESYAFAPFQVSGSVSSLNGDNYQVQVLFPATEYAIKLVEKGNGNRKSILQLNTRFVSESGTISNNGPSEQYVGLGASFSAETIELRFNTAVDAVLANFPANRLNEDNVGILPLDSVLSLR